MDTKGEADEWFAYFDKTGDGWKLEYCGPEEI
jgi:hypothetical protein